jgi:hypothetical protein
MPISMLLQATTATGREQLLIAQAAGYARVVSELPDKIRAIRAAAAALVEGAVPCALIGGLAVGIRSGVRDQGDIALLEGDVPEPNEGW